MTEHGKGLTEALALIKKAYGEGSVMRVNEAPRMDVEVISTGALSLDLALGCGGLPRGRAVELFGPESCVDADTFVHYEVRTPDGKRQDDKGGSISSLWHRFHQIERPRSGAYLRPSTKGSVYFAPCMNDEGRIFQNQILDVVHTGSKPCFTVITTEGKITATAEHKFFTDGRFLPLSDLKIGDQLMIHNNTHFQNGGEERDCKSWRPDIYVAPIHPHAPKKSVTTDAVEYTYSRLQLSRAVAEAALNGLTLIEYRQKFTEGDLSGFSFLDPSCHVHHVDENYHNNDPDNLVVISPTEHGRLHPLENANNLRFTVVGAEIIDIMAIGERDTYDLRMESPYNNYVAQGFVVHNSGKTTLALHVIAEAQKKGGICAIVDAEHALDPVYAAAIGVDLNELLISQPNNGEEALEIVDMLCRSNEMAVIVVDSVAALVPRAEIEGDMGDSHVGLQARLMSQAMRKLTGNMKRAGTLVIFINQIREKIGVIYGSPETTPGGRALKFYSSVRLDVRRRDQIKDGTDVEGNKTEVKVVKNKVGAPFKKAEFDIMYGTGISQEGCTLDVAEIYGIIEKKGAWYSYDGSNIGQGRENTKQYLADNPDVMDEVDRLTRVAMNGGVLPD